jgi:hypothetical protein
MCRLPGMIVPSYSRMISVGSSLPRLGSMTKRLNCDRMTGLSRASPKANATPAAPTSQAMWRAMSFGAIPRSPPLTQGGTTFDAWSQLTTQRPGRSLPTMTNAKPVSAIQGCSRHSPQIWQGPSCGPQSPDGRAIGKASVSANGAVAPPNQLRHNALGHETKRLQEGTPA